MGWSVEPQGERSGMDLVPHYLGIEPQGSWQPLSKFAFLNFPLTCPSSRPTSWGHWECNLLRVACTLACWLKVLWVCGWVGQQMRLAGGLGNPTQACPQASRRVWQLLVFLAPGLQPTDCPSLESQPPNTFLKYLWIWTRAGICSNKTSKSDPSLSLMAWNGDVSYLVSPELGPLPLLIPDCLPYGELGGMEPRSCGFGGA